MKIIPDEIPDNVVPLPEDHNVQPSSHPFGIESLEGKNAYVDFTSAAGYPPKVGIVWDIDVVKYGNTFRLGNHGRYLFTDVRSFREV